MGGVKNFIKSPKRMFTAAITGGASEMLRGGIKAIAPKQPGLNFGGGTPYQPNGSSTGSPFSQVMSQDGRNYQGANLQYAKDGKALLPGRETARDASGNLDARFKLTPGAVDYDRGALDKYKAEAMRTGPSQWATNQYGKLDLQNQNNIAGLAKDTNSGLASRVSNLAQTGGVSSSARERMGRQSMKDLIMNRQNLNRNTQMDKMGIDIQDESTRMSNLQNAQNMENTYGDKLANERGVQSTAQQFNIQNALGDVNSGNQYNSDAYAEAMKAWAANKSADASAKAAAASKPKPGLLGSVFGGLF